MEGEGETLIQIRPRETERGETGIAEAARRVRGSRDVVEKQLKTAEGR